MLRRRTEPWRSDAPHEEQAPTSRAMPLSVVEIPRDAVPGGGPPPRSHHALSLHLESAERAARTWGVDASDCNVQFRMPTKIVQTRGSAALDVAAQVRFGCRL